MQRTLGTVLLAVMVVFSGCGGVLGGGSDESVKTFTPAPDPTPKPTPTPVPQLAPGLTGQGIENSYVLLAASKSFYRNQSFTIRTNYTGSASNGSVLIRETDVIRVGPPGEGFHIVPARNGSDEHRHSETLPIYTELWSDGERVLLKRRYANGTVIYDRVRTMQFRDSLAHGRLPYFLASSEPANTSVTAQFTRNGTTLYRVQGTGWSELWGNVSIQLLVDSSGVIHEYRIAYRVPSEYSKLFEKNVSRIIIEQEFSNIGTTDAPERPSWVDEALNRTTPIPEDPRGPYDESGNSTDTNRTASKTTTSG